MPPQLNPLLARHTFVEKRPALPTFKLLVSRLFPAIGPFFLVLAPLLLRRLPLLCCPLLDLRRRGGLRRRRSRSGQQSNGRRRRRSGARTRKNGPIAGNSRETRSLKVGRAGRFSTN